MHVGDVVANRYRLERLLGEGGMGSVWAATHTVTQRTHALKLLKKKDDDPATRRRMLREARAASAVRHPNVVTIHDVIEGPDGAPVLVMDLLDGESLGDRLEREKKLDVRETLRIVRAILEALEAAHAAGVVHRDLKPDNVFLAQGNVKVLDFGVAKLTASDGPARATTNLLTESGAMLGTPCYMAPEQAFAEGEVDARADLWAVGVVLYECLAGVRPADGATLGQVLKVLATGAIVPLAQRAPDVPADVAALVGRLLASDRDARPASARAVLDALDAIEGVAAISVHDAPSPRRPRGRAALFAAAVALILGLGGAAAVAARRQPLAEAAAPSPPLPPPAASIATAPPEPSASIAPIATAEPSPPVLAPKAAVAKPRVAPPASAPAPTPARVKPASSKSDSKLLTDVPF